MENLFGKLTSISWPVWLAMGVFVVGAVVLLVMRKRENSKWDARALSYGAICVALAFVLSCIRLWRMPQGGSLTAGSMIPIFLFAYLFGGKRGLLCGLVYGLLQLLQDFYFVHPIQLVLDYGCFALLGLAGFFPKKLWLGALVGGLARIACHILSGAIFFASYAGDMNPWWYSTTYNVGVLAPDLAICLLVFALPPIQRMIERLKQNTAPKAQLS